MVLKDIIKVEKTILYQSMLLQNKTNDVFMLGIVRIEL